MASLNSAELVQDKNISLTDSEIQSMNPTQLAIYEDYGLKLNEQEAFEFKKIVVEYIKLLYKMKKETDTKN